MSDGNQHPSPNAPRNPRLAHAQVSDCSTPGCCSGRTSALGRREFIKLAGAGAAALSIAGGGLRAMAGPFEAKDTIDHCVPADKKLSSEWIKGLFARGEPTVYSGSDLVCVGMPVGGLCTGQLYLTGDGRLAHWDIFNWATAGYGYEVSRRPAMPVEQGFAVRVRQGDKTLVRTLDINGFPGVRFRGEYPLATIDYEDVALPVAVKLEAFSPFIPLNAADSGLPATVMQFTVKNTSDADVEATLAGWLQNAVCCHSAAQRYGLRKNRLVEKPGMKMILCGAEAAEPPKDDRPPIVLADFEGSDYGQWKAEGEAFGKGPAPGTLAGQQPVEGFQGKGLVNTYLGGDGSHGKLISPALKIERAFISFLIGGGAHRDKTCIRLLVDGKVVRSAEGQDLERLTWHNWDVRELAGKEARIEIVDAESGAWGHINIDQIEMRDQPVYGLGGPLDELPDFGTMGLAMATAEQVDWCTALPDGPLPDTLFGDKGANPGEKPLGEQRRLDERLVGALGRTIKLKPGEEARVSFVVAWCFPNRPKTGQFYRSRFATAADVAEYVARELDRLAGQTRLWHDTYYDSTLPYWLLDRLHSTVSTLATSTCEWWQTGRFWAWEGVRCCEGTCGHVWNYAHAAARLFPELERSVREMQDFNPEVGLTPSGMIRFRGVWPDFWAGDAQNGYILKAYREHQISADSEFLKRNWPNIRKALEYAIKEDANDDGLVEGSQHNTYDINFEGPNTMVGSLYLAALRAGEEMAREMGDLPFADRCRRIFESGRKLSVERLYNGEYFIQIVDLQKYPRYQYGDGCLADQLFGQGWAHQVALGYIYPEETVHSALASIWKYDWAPDIDAQNKAHPPQRWFAYPGEAGLFTCTWPRSKHLGPHSVLYRDEIWTGIEYQVAGHMAWERMTTEALAICRAVHDRYHPSKHNPWNEIECGDHYARGMASWSVLTGLCGFEYHGPKGHIGFAPRMTPDDFRAPFTAAQGWGILSQKRDGTCQIARIEPKWGRLSVKTVALELPENAKLAGHTVTVGGKPLEASAGQEGRRVTVTLAELATIEQNGHIEITLTC